MKSFRKKKERKLWHNFSTSERLISRAHYSTYLREITRRSRNNISVSERMCVSSREKNNFILSRSEYVLEATRLVSAGYCWTYKLVSLGWTFTNEPAGIYGELRPSAVALGENQTQNATDFHREKRKLVQWIFALIRPAPRYLDTESCISRWTIIHRIPNNSFIENKKGSKKWRAVYERWAAGIGGFQLPLVSNFRRWNRDGPMKENNKGTWIRDRIYMTDVTSRAEYALWLEHDTAVLRKR